jgi:hypothetical protein
MRRAIVGLAAAVLAAGGLGVPGPAPQDFWCPGQPIPTGALWNMATCHTYHYVPGADGTQIAVQGPPPACGPNPC